MPVTELLADDEPLVRVGLRAVLEARSGIELVGEAADSAAVIPPVRQLRSVSVTSHAGAVPAKLGARNRTQAVTTAYESGFVAPG